MVIPTFCELVKIDDNAKKFDTHARGKCAGKTDTEIPAQKSDYANRKNNYPEPIKQASAKARQIGGGEALPHLHWQPPIHTKDDPWLPWPDEDVSSTPINNGTSKRKSVPAIAAMPGTIIKKERP